MGQSVKLADDLVEMVRHEAKLHHRSIAGQVSHWLKIGRAIEQSGKLDYKRVDAALCGVIDTTELTEAEEAVWVDAFTEKMGHPTDAERELHRQRRGLRLSGELGTDGNLLHTNGDNGVRS
ncbi:hypothetical protein GLP43_13160 [Sulfitobacter sp. M39]|nr:hypothetical protein [Sulfitobacter sp. M39]MCF7748507.1 hypothetical protein [Sulfitobacter sp. M39]